VRGLLRQPGYFLHRDESGDLLIPRKGILSIREKVDEIAHANVNSSTSSVVPNPLSTN
jgi:hypothetical protein